MTLPHQRYAPSRLDRPGLAESGRVEAVFSGQKMLRIGVSGPDVAMAQQALFLCGARLPVTTSQGTRTPDGVFGNETAASVLAFQKANALGADAIVGPKTIRALDGALAKAGLAALMSVVGQFIAAVRASGRLPGGAGLNTAQDEPVTMGELSALLAPIDLSAWRDPQRASDAEIEATLHRETGRLKAFDNQLAVADAGVVSVPVLLAILAAAAAATGIAIQQLPKPKLPELPTATPPEILPNLVGPVVVAAAIAKLNKELERWRKTALNVKEVVARCLALGAASQNSLCQHLAAEIAGKADIMLDRIANVFENFKSFNLDTVIKGLEAIFDDIAKRLAQLAQACDCPLFKGET